MNVDAIDRDHDDFDIATLERVDNELECKPALLNVQVNRRSLHELSRFLKATIVPSGWRRVLIIPLDVLPMMSGTKSPTVSR